MFVISQKGNTSDRDIIGKAEGKRRLSRAVID
jgi:hypothetical protein